MFAGQVEAVGKVAPLKFEHAEKWIDRLAEQRFGRLCSIWMMPLPSFEAIMDSSPPRSA